MITKVDIEVIQKPDYVTFICPNCGEEIAENFTLFEATAGEVCNWEYSIILCPECGEMLQIRNIEWI